MDEFVPKKKRSRTEKDNLRQRLAREKGKIGERIEEHTPLYQKCPQCGGIGELYEAKCLCDRGFLQTAWAVQRCDALVAENDTQLAFLGDLREVLTINEGGQGLNKVLELLNIALAGRDTAIEDARSRTYCD